MMIIEEITPPLNYEPVGIDNEGRPVCPFCGTRGTSREPWGQRCAHRWHWYAGDIMAVEIGGASDED